MKKTILVLAVLVSITFGLKADDATIKKMDQGEKVYKSTCIIARDLGLTRVGGEYDESGRLRPEFDAKKVIPKTTVEAIKWVAKKVDEAVTKAGERKVKEALENSEDPEK